MKKLALTIFSLMIFTVIQGQIVALTDNNGIPYLPKKGDFSIGTDIIPILNIFNKNGAVERFDFVNSIPVIAFRNLIADNRALRTEILANYTSIKLEEAGKINKTSLGLGFGHEWRYGETRVQGFWGFGGGALYSKTKSLDNYDNIDDEVSELAFGIEAFLGAEYFIAPKLSLGGQFEWGPSYSIINDLFNEVKINTFNLSTRGLNSSIIVSFYF